MGAFAFGAQMSNSSHSDRTLFTNHNGADSSDTFESDASNDGTPRLAINVNGKDVAINNDKTYGENGLNTSDINYMVVAAFPIVKGDNVIKMTTHATAGYRLMVGGEVRLYFAGPEVPEPFVPGDGVFSELTTFSEAFNTLTEKQAQLVNYDKSYAVMTRDEITAIADGSSNASAPKPVHITWKHAPKYEGCVYNVEVSKNAEFPEGETFVYTSKVKEADLYNFELGATYNYRVKAVYPENDPEYSSVGTVTIANAPIRNVHIDGMTNCRDLGGKVLENGSTFKQGVIYRTSACVDRQSGCNVTATGKYEMTKILGVKAEIDLRGGANGTGGEGGSSTASELDSSIKYNFGPMAYDGGRSVLFRNVEPIRKIFKVLGDESNYPVFFHCRIGTDRTGALAVLINGLVGLSEEEIYLDYLFSNFGNIGDTRIVDNGNRDSIKGYVEEIKAYPGATLADKFYNFLLSIGVPADNLDTVIRMATEGDEKTVNTGDVKVFDLDDAEMVGGATKQTSNAFRSAPEYVALAAADQGVSFAADVEDANYKVIAYINSTDGEASLQNALKLEIDGKVVNMPAASFAPAELGLGGDFWIPVEIASVALKQGKHAIDITSLGTAVNVGHLALVCTGK